MRQFFPNMNLEALDASHWREPFIAFYSILFFTDIPNCVPFTGSWFHALQYMLKSELLSHLHS